MKFCQLFFLSLILDGEQQHQQPAEAKLFMTDTDSNFVHPEEIRGSTPTRIDVAENRHIYTALDYGDFDISSNDIWYADYDTIFSAALDLHLMEIAVPRPIGNENIIKHIIPATPHRHYPMDPTSNWAEEVRHAQVIIDENVADMLASKLAKAPKKSFVVEFSSAKEYEQFLEFKNKLTASSCSSPSADECLASSFITSPLPNVLHHKRQYKGGETGIESISTYHTTTPSTSPSSLSSDSSSSSYLATLTEEDEEENKEIVEPYANRNVSSTNFETIIINATNEQDKDDEILSEFPLHELSSDTNGKKAGEVGGPKAEGNCACPDFSVEEPKRIQIPVEARNGATTQSGVDFGDTNKQDVKQTISSCASSFSTDDARIYKDNSCAPVTCLVGGFREGGQVQELPVPSATSIVDCSTGIFPSGPEQRPISTWLRRNENQKNSKAKCSVSSTVFHRCESVCRDSGFGCDLNEKVTYFRSENHSEELRHEEDEDEDEGRDCEKSKFSNWLLEKETNFNSACYPCVDSRTCKTITCAEEYCSGLHNVERCSSSGLKSVATANNNNNSAGDSERVQISNNNDDDSYDTNGTFFSCCNSPLTSPSGDNCCVVGDGDKCDTDNLNESGAHTNGCLKLNISANIKSAVVDNLDDFPPFTSTSAQLEDRISICPAPPAEILLAGQENYIALPFVQENGSKCECGLDLEDQPNLSERERGVDTNISGSGLRASSSTSSLNSSFSENSASFVASIRLKRLEERLKRFQYTKKLVSDPKDSGEGNSICDTTTRTTTTKGSPLRNSLDYDESDDDEQQKLIRDITKRLQDNFDQNKFVSKKALGEANRNNEDTLNELVATATSIVEELERVDLDRNNNYKNRDFDGANCREFDDNFDFSDEAVTRFATPSPTSLENNNATETAKPYSKCTFNTRELANYPSSSSLLQECYDELVDEELQLDVFSPPELNREQEEYCDCVLEAYPLNYIEKSGATRNRNTEMRETTGPLRGLLKKPNRLPQERKNRVVFDETRNEFFDADYIILIREDCPYDEEDEEPCTCGEHELVRLCCEEGCQCPGYIEGDGKTPQVR